MNNIEKKLDALIDALGFDVEEVETFNEAQYLVKAEDYKNNPNDYRGSFCKSPPFKASYIEIDYKVTKRKSQQGIDDNKLSEPKPRVDIEKILDPKSTMNGIVLFIDDTPIDQLVKNILVLSKLEDNLRFIEYKKHDLDRVVNWFGDLAKDVGDNFFVILGVDVYLIGDK